MSVFFVDHARELGGAERSLLLLLQHLDRQRFLPHLACGGDPLARGDGRLRQVVDRGGVAQQPRLGPAHSEPFPRTGNVVEAQQVQDAMDQEEVQFGIERYAELPRLPGRGLAAHDRRISEAQDLPLTHGKGRWIPAEEVLP